MNEYEAYVKILKSDLKEISSAEKAEADLRTIWKKSLSLKIVTYSLRIKMTRPTIRYAIEKMDTQTRKDLLSIA